MDNGYGIDVIYLDFQKTFDKIPYKILLKKLKWYGFDGKLLLWIVNFLKDRQMKDSPYGPQEDGRDSCTASKTDCNRYMLSNATVGVEKNQHQPNL